MIIEILAGVAAKLASLTVAAKAAVGVGVATAAIGAVGVTGLVPVPGINPGDSNVAVEVQLPSVPTANADLGLQLADDAINANADVSADVSGTSGKPDVTGLDRAAQTPAPDHLPSFVPGPPAGVPAGDAPTGTPGAAGTDIAKQTPAAGRIPR